MSELDQLSDLLDGMDSTLTSDPLEGMEWNELAPSGSTSDFSKPQSKTNKPSSTKSTYDENLDFQWNDTDFEIKGTIGRKQMVPAAFDEKAFGTIKFDTIKLPSFQSFQETNDKGDDNAFEDFNFEDFSAPVESKPTPQKKMTNELFVNPKNKPVSTGVQPPTAALNSNAKKQSDPSFKTEAFSFDPNTVQFDPIDVSDIHDASMFDPIPVSRPKAMTTAPRPAIKPSNSDFPDVSFDIAPTVTSSVSSPAAMFDDIPSTMPPSSGIFSATSSPMASFSVAPRDSVGARDSMSAAKADAKQNRMSVAVNRNRLSKNFGQSMFGAADSKEKQQLAKNWRMSSYIPKGMVEKKTQKIISIFLIDKSRKKIAVSMDDTVQEVIDQFSSKLDLIQNEFFSLSEGRKNGTDRWLSPKRTLEQEGVNENTALVFKIKYFKQPVKVFDPQAIHLFFLQVKQNVIMGQYPASERLIIRLAAYHFHSVYGPHLPQKHRPGFLGEEGLKDYLPAEVIAACSSSYLETRIYRRHAQLKKLTKLAAEQEYLEVARQIPTFGVTVYNVQDSVRSRRICVAEDGILISKKDQDSQYDYYTYHQLGGWALNDGGFEIYVLRTDGKLGRHIFKADAEKSQNLIELMCGYYKYYSLIDATLPKIKLPIQPTDLQSHELFRVPQERYIYPPGNSRLEIFRRSYLENCHVEGMVPSSHMLIQIDEILDEDAVFDTINLSYGKCDLLHLYVLKQSLSSISLIDENMFEGYEDNVMLNTVDLSHNPNLGPKAAQLMGEILEFVFPIKVFKADNTNIGFNGSKTLSLVFKDNRILEELHVADCHLTGKGVALIVKSFKESGNMRYFDFSNNGLEDSVCKILGGMASANSFVRSLILSKNKITDSGMNMLLKGLIANRGLLHIDLSYNPISSKTSTKLAEWVSTSYQLNGLNFSGLKLNAKGGKMVAKLLGSGASLTSLNLSYNILDKALVDILEKVKDSRTLKELQLSGNAFDSKAGQTLVDCFTKNGSLQSLALKDCKLTKTVLMSLAQTMMSHATIKKLDLAANDMSNEDVAASIGDMLSRSTTLTELNLSACQFSVEGFRHIANSIKSTPTLKSLGLSQNKLGKLSFLTFSENLVSNFTLENVSLRANELNTSHLEDFVRCLSSDDACPNLDSVDVTGNDGLKVLNATIKLPDVTQLLNKLSKLHFAVEY